MDITSFIMGYNKGKQSASGGGGSGEAVVWFVSFMGADGSLLFKMPVLDGDDCKNPITHGDITTPTKESSAQYNYTYSGWSLTEGGTADTTNALANVTEDRTVYAAFTETVRKYTVRFYDGETLLKTEQIAYGGSSSYEYRKENMLFTGWNPEPTNITADMDCQGVWVESYTFADASWEYITQMSESGNASKVFALGDTKSVEVTTYSGAKLSCDVRIVGFDHDDLANGTGKAGLSLMFVNAFATSGVFSNDADDMDMGEWTGRTYFAGANGKSPRDFINTTVLSSLQADLQSIIKSVTKQVCIGGAEKTITTTNDKIWYPGFREVGSSYANDGAKYSYFNTNTTWYNSVKVQKADSVSEPLLKDNYNYGHWGLRSVMYRSSSGRNQHAGICYVDGSIKGLGEAAFLIGFCV